MQTMLGSGSQSDGSVCSDVITTQGDTVIAGDAIALSSRGPAIQLHAGDIVGQDVVTGGGTVGGLKGVQVGGRVDTTGDAPEIANCIAAGEWVSAQRAEFLAEPESLSLRAIHLPKGRSQRIPAAGTLGPGRIIIDVPSVRLDPESILTLVGDPATTQVIVRVAGRGSLIDVEDSARIMLSGLQPEQVLFMVNGPITMQDSTDVSANLLATGLITVGRSGEVDGMLLSGTGFKLSSYASVVLHPFVAW